MPTCHLHRLGGFKLSLAGFMPCVGFIGALSLPNISGHALSYKATQGLRPLPYAQLGSSESRLEGQARAQPCCSPAPCGLGFTHSPTDPSPGRAHPEPPAAAPGCCSQLRCCTHRYMSPPAPTGPVPGIAASRPPTPVPGCPPPQAGADLGQ